jgi:hypothetical protein
VLNEVEDLMRVVSFLMLRVLYRGYFLCGHQVLCYKLIGIFVRCNHIAGPNAIVK